MLGFHLLDTVVHAWDVAVSVGQTVHLEADVLIAVRRVTDAVPDGTSRDLPGARFARSVAATSIGLLEGILADLGRDVDWPAPLVTP